jgi:hypothetical protein
MQVPAPGIYILAWQRAYACNTVFCHYYSAFTLPFTFATTSAAMLLGAGE